ncbi:hypothetical protein [Streptomyces nitrosporeus]|uniref:hypothetical protein n=1 Tax=Streptomyces nitrosporeus TaxID=28894 RepID=UPI001E360F07|nr:hypothetical protein [Streptomyces nitrosporeus]
MADERLGAEWLRGWCEQAEAALAKLMESFQARHGFEPGSNVIVHVPDASRRATDALVELTPVPSDLATMHWVVAEVSLPDVENGCLSTRPRLSRSASASTAPSRSIR